MTARLRLLPALLLACAAPLRAQACTRPRTALVLSGGGARGLAHVGVLIALDSLHIRPDLIVGTSMGAVIGALYASGYSGREIDSIARAAPLARVFGSYEPVALRSLDDLQPLVAWRQGSRGLSLQSASVSEPEVNALLSSVLLRGNLLARGDFDSLPIPFRAVATRLADRTRVVLRSGDLARAVRASLAIPLLIGPERVDGELLGDGGLVANVPVAVAREAGAQRVIVSDATTEAADTTRLDAPLALATHLVDLLFHQPPDSLGPGDVRIAIPLGAYPQTDFAHADFDQLVDAGRRAADAALHADSCVPPPKATGRPPRYLAQFAVSAERPADSAALRAMLGVTDGGEIRVRALQRRLSLLGESERYDGVWLTPRRAGDDSVSFDVDVDAAPRRSGGMGIAYDHDLGGRAWLGMVDRRLLGTDAEGSVVVRAGTLRQELGASLRRGYLLGDWVVSPLADLSIAKEDVQRFDADGGTLAPFVVREASLLLGVERVFPGGWSATAGVSGIAWHDSSRTHGRALGGAARVQRVSRAGERLVQASVEWNSEFHRAAIDVVVPRSVGRGRLRITPRIRAGWGESLPLQALFPLGGDDGFPGLHLGEQRGDRELFASTLLTYPVVGPVVARVELAAGSSTVGGPVVPEGGWLAGVRGGLGLDTPLGPVRLEYGYSSRHRAAVFVRVGRWF